MASFGRKLKIEVSKQVRNTIIEKIHIIFSQCYFFIVAQIWYVVLVLVHSIRLNSHSVFKFSCLISLLKCYAKYETDIDFQSTSETHIWQTLINDSTQIVWYIYITVVVLNYDSQISIYQSVYRSPVLLSLGSLRK